MLNVLSPHPLGTRTHAAHSLPIHGCRQLLPGCPPTYFPHLSRDLSSAKRLASLNCARRTTTALSWGFREHELLPPSLPSVRGHQATYEITPTTLGLFSSRESGLLGLPLRASNEALRRARVPRAQETNRLPSPLFLRVPPRIPCRSPSPRIKRISPLPSEPLNFPQLSSTFSPSQRRHSSCSST